MFLNCRCLYTQNHCFVENLAFWGYRSEEKLEPKIQFSTSSALTCSWISSLSVLIKSLFEKKYKNVAFLSNQFGATYPGTVVVEHAAICEFLNFAVSILLHQLASMCFRSSFTFDGEINGLAGAFLSTVENTLSDISRQYDADLAGEQGPIGIANKVCITRKLIQNLLLGSNPCVASSEKAKQENISRHFCRTF